MKFFKYIALAVLASTISANAVGTKTVGSLKKTDTVVTAVDDLIDETELTTALAPYATKTWSATTATNAANHAASSKVTKVTGAQSGHVVKFASGEEEYENGKLPEPAPAKVTTEGEDLVPYKVRPGETLSSLSALGLDWMDDLTYDPSPDKSKPDRNAGRKWLAQDKWIKEVMMANPYLDPNKIQAGQTIYIPKDLYGGIRSRDWYDMSSDDRLDWWDRVARETAADDGPLAVQDTGTSEQSAVVNKDGSKSYVVQPGDDIYSIALKLGVPPLTLRNTHSDGKFRVGETVVVP